MLIPDQIFDLCWRFIRGDTPVGEFEKWVYRSSELEPLFPEDFYMMLISTDYSEAGPVFELKRKLKHAIDGAGQRDCYCHTLSDVADVGMGEHEAIFKSLDEQAKYGDPLWWLWLAKCGVCEQFWMIASEERINDVFLMRRLPQSISEQIISGATWPDDFKEFETLLRLGKERGHSVRFMDLVSPALVATMIDLARAKPGIEIRELSDLLQISLEQAQAVAAEAVKEIGVKISI